MSISIKLMWHDDISAITQDQSPEVHISHPTERVYDTEAILRSFYNATGPIVIRDESGTASYVWHSDVPGICSQFLRSRQAFFGLDHLAVSYDGSSITFSTKSSGSISIRCVIDVPKTTSDDIKFAPGDRIDYADYSPSGFEYVTSIEPNAQESNMNYVSYGADGWFSTSVNTIPYFNQSFELSGKESSTGNAIIYGRDSGNSSHSLYVPSYSGRDTISITRPNSYYNQTFSRSGAVINGKPGVDYKIYAFYKMHPFFILSGNRHDLSNAASNLTRMIAFNLSCVNLADSVINTQTDTYQIPMGNSLYIPPYTVEDNGEYVAGGVFVSPLAQSYPSGYSPLSGPNPHYNNAYPALGEYKGTIIYRGRNGNVVSKVVSVKCINPASTIVIPRRGRSIVPRQSDVYESLIYPAAIYTSSGYENISASDDIVVTISTNDSATPVSYRQSELDFPLTPGSIGYTYSNSISLITVSYGYTDESNLTITDSYSIEYVDLGHNPFIVDKV